MEVLFYLMFKKTFLGLSRLLLACTRSLPPEDYMKWCNNPENGLIIRKEYPPFVFSLEYRPQDLVALQNTVGEETDQVEFSGQLEELRQYQYYNFKISSEANVDFLKAGIQSQQEYFERIGYFSSFAQPDFLDGTDTLTCAMYHFERNYGISPYQTIILGFQNPNPDVENKTLVYLDKVLGVPEVRLQITAESIKQIPNLKL